MKKASFILAMAGSAAILTTTGCLGRIVASSSYAGRVMMRTLEPGPTITQSTGDHLHSINAVIEMDRRALFEDIDLLMQTNRPTRLTRWVER